MASNNIGAHNNMGAPGFGGGSIGARAEHPGTRGELGRLRGGQGFGEQGIGGQGANPQGTWLTHQQFQEYQQLLKERAQAQQIVSVPLGTASYPTRSLGVGGSGLAPYSVSQPGYGFLAPSSGGGKAAGYGGLPIPRPTELNKPFRGGGA